METQVIEFQAWPKIPRLNRDVVLSEKIDGSNAAVGVLEDGTVYAQSRKRIITPDDDNFGFARWVHENAEELAATLGPGLHFGEWWGQGIQRRYGLEEKRFSLFNTHRWNSRYNLTAKNGTERDLDEGHTQCIEAPLCHVIPLVAIETGFADIGEWIDSFKAMGSLAVPGFMNPEGIVAYHVASNQCFKVTCEKDETWKG